MTQYLGEIVAAAVALGAVLLVAFNAAKAELTTKAKAAYAVGAAAVAAFLVAVAERIG